MNCYARGFFLEPFGMVNGQKFFEEIYGTDSDDAYVHELRIGHCSRVVGGKIVSRKNFVFEVFGGVGRNIIQSDPDVGSEFVPPAGINLGYRF